MKLFRASVNERALLMKWGRLLIKTVYKKKRNIIIKK